jgi:hypothetical protein
MKYVSPFALFANESAKPNPGGELSTCWANEFKDADEGLTVVQLAPFGSFPNVQGLQVFHPKDAANITSDIIANVKMRVGPGLPWYVGHPDHPLHRDKYKDGLAYGRIKALEARSDANCPACAAFMANSQNGNEPCREHGLFAKVKFNEAGKKLIANEAYDAHSVNWRLRKQKDGWHPFSLKSVGFTNEPNIPVPAITSANELCDCEWAGDEDLTAAHFKKLAGVRMMANACGTDEEAKYQTMKNSFGPWQDWDACILHMTTKGGYDMEAAKNVCGRLKADLEGANAIPEQFKRLAKMRKK